MKKLLILILIAISLAACGRTDNALTYRTIFDDIAGVMITENNNAALYDEVLSVVADYATNPTPKNLEAAIKLLAENINKIQASQIFESNLSEKEINFMMNNDIDIADYTAGFAQQQAFRDRYIKDIEEFIYAFDNMNIEQLREFLAIKTLLHECAKRVTIIGYNHLFAHVGENDLAYFKAEILPQLDLLTYDVTWSKSKTELEEEVLFYLDEMRRYLGVLEIFLNDWELERLRGGG
jgi:hypothetical protein